MGIPPKWMVYHGTSYWNGWFRAIPIFGHLHIGGFKQRSWTCRVGECWGKDLGSSEETWNTGASRAYAQSQGTSRAVGVTLLWNGWMPDVSLRRAADPVLPFSRGFRVSLLATLWIDCGRTRRQWDTPLIAWAARSCPRELAQQGKHTKNGKLGFASSTCIPKGKICKETASLVPVDLSRWSPSPLLIINP